MSEPRDPRPDLLLALVLAAGVLAAVFVFARLIADAALEYLESLP